MVPINDKIPINKINSKNAWVLRNTEKMAIPAIKLMPIKSKACIRSALDGPFTTRYRLRRMVAVRIHNEIIINNLNIFPSHILYRSFKNNLGF